MKRFCVALLSLAAFALAHAGAQPGVSSQRLLDIQAEVDKGRGQLVGPEVKGLTAAEKDAYYSKSNRCRNVGMLLQQLAGYRSTQTPEETLKLLRSFSKQGDASVPEPEIKRYINLAFFDPQFRLSSSDSFAFEVSDSCMHDWKAKFQPLK